MNFTMTPKKSALALLLLALAGARATVVLKPKDCPKAERWVNTLDRFCQELDKEMKNEEFEKSTQTTFHKDASMLLAAVKVTKREWTKYVQQAERNAKKHKNARNSQNKPRSPHQPPTTADKQTVSPRSSIRRASATSLKQSMKKKQPRKEETVQNTVSRIDKQRTSVAETQAKSNAKAAASDLHVTQPNKGKKLSLCRISTKPRRNPDDILRYQHAGDGREQSDKNFRWNSPGHRRLPVLERLLEDIKRANGL